MTDKEKTIQETEIIEKSFNRAQNIAPPDKDSNDSSNSSDPIGNESSNNSDTQSQNDCEGD